MVDVYDNMKYANTHVCVTCFHSHVMSRDDTRHIVLDLFNLYTQHLLIINQTYITNTF